MAPEIKIQIFVVVIMLMIFVIVMIVSLAIIIILLQKKQKTFVTDLLTVKANYEKERYKAQMEIQEQTFQDISREIHDNVGQMLSLAKLGVNMLDLERPEEAKNDVLEISDILDKSLDQLRHLCRSMNSDLIKSRGLIKSIELQAGFLQSGNKYKIDFIVSGKDVQLSETQEVILFRIVQEAITNILRHSQATSITILLDYEAEFVTLKIADNGKGFLIFEKQNNHTQMNGIHNMQHRAKLIEADFEVISEPGHGTSIIVKTPY